MIFRGNFSDFFEETMLPALHHLIKEEWGAVPEQWSEIFRTETSTRSIEQVGGVSGVGMFSQIEEGEAVRYDQPVQMYNKTFKHTRYGLGIKITQDAVEDDQIGLIQRNTRALARSNRETLEIDMAATFNNGFDSNYAGPDGKSLFASDHPLAKAGGTQSNLLSNADFDIPSLQLAMTAYETLVDDTGINLSLPTPRVVAPPQLRWDVAEVLESKMRSDTANNTTNAFAYAGNDGMPGWMIWRYLLDSDAWFLVAPKESTELVMFWRRKPYTKGSADFDTEVGKVARRYKKSHGFAHYLGTYGAPGA